MPPDDERLARALRELRQRSGWTQAQAAATAGTTVRMLRRVERGGCGSLPLEMLRRMAEAYGARVRVSVWWHGADLDRVLDEAHAAVVELVVLLLRHWGWSTAVEVTFSEYGERGSVDVLAFHPASGSGLVVEVKASLGSIEETNRALDAKFRLGAKLIRNRLGVEPRAVSRLLVLPEDMSLRRIVARHASTFGSVYPLRSRAIRTWLRRPRDWISGLWFLSMRSASDLPGAPRSWTSSHIPSEGRVMDPSEEPTGPRRARARPGDT